MVTGRGKYDLRYTRSKFIRAYKIDPLAVLQKRLRLVRAQEEAMKVAREYTAIRGSDPTPVA